MTVADQAVRDRFLTELDRSAVVEAGAGTGKTTLVVDRIVALVSGRRAADAQGRGPFGDPVEPLALTDVVAITFTDLAAAELAERLRERLTEARAAAVVAGDDDLAAHLDRALVDLPGAAISTIHGFSSRILREFALEAGLDPAFEVLEATASRRLIQEVFDTWFEDVAREPAVRRALTHGVSLDMIETRARELLYLGAAVDAAEPMAPGPGFRDLARRHFADFDDWVAEREAWLGQGLDLPPASKYSKVLDAAEELLAGHRAILVPYGQDLDEDRAEAAWAALELELFQASWRDRKYGHASAKKWADAVAGAGGPDQATIKQRSADFIAAMAELRAAVAQDLLADLEPHLIGFRKHYQEEKRGRSQLDFDDLLAEAERLVRERPEVRRRLIRRYRCLFVDEFQDTDPIQAGLVFLLGGGEDTVEETDWARVPPAPGRLVLVGDPKQSIYRFRKADVEIFRRAADRVLEADPEAAFSITTNFRTDGPLVDWVGARFEEGPAVMRRPDDGEYQADFQALVPFKVDEGAARPVLVLRQDEAERPKGADASRAAEGRAVARLLAGTFRDADGHPVGARLVPDGPELGLGGVAVVARTAKVLGAYAAALAAEGLPYVSEGGGKLFDTEEVQTALLVLTAVVSPGRETAVVGALRSVWFGLSDDALLAHRLAGGHLDPLAGQDAQPEGSVRIALARLGAWARRAAAEPEAVVGEVLRDPGVLLLLGLRPDGIQAPMNMLLLERILVDGLTGGGSLAAAVRHATELARSGSDAKGARLDLPGAVRLLTIHGAKGLEFPLVVLAEPGGKGPSGGEAKPAIDGEGRLVWGFSGGLVPASHDAFKRWSADREQAEQLRLFYVALTRAKHHLLLPVFAAQDQWGKPLLDGATRFAFGKLLGAQLLTIPESGEETEPTGRGGMLELDAVDAPPPAWPEAGPERVEALASDSTVRTAPCALAARLAARPAARPTPLAPSRVLDDEAPVPHESADAPVGEVSGDTARTLGTLTHLCLELGLTPEAAAQRALAEGHDGEAAAFVSGCVAAAAGLPYTERSAGAARVLEEPALLWRPTPRGEAGDRLMRGFIDRLIDYGDGSVEVVDYKTDRVSGPDELAERTAHHRLQLGFYGVALEEAGLRVRALTLAFLAAGEEVRLELDDDLRAEVRAALERAT